MATKRSHDQRVGPSHQRAGGALPNSQEAGQPSADMVLAVVGLLDRPGASRRIDLALPVPADLDLPLATVTEPIRLRGEVAGVVEGVLVRGALSADLRLRCARCLNDVPFQFVTDVVELYSDPLRSGLPRSMDALPEDAVEEGYEIIDKAIDLETLVRDALVLAVPYQPLCDIACKGLCPICGGNRNEVECACQETSTDPRWAALAHLRLRADGA